MGFTVSKKKNPGKETSKGHLLPVPPPPQCFVEGVWVVSRVLQVQHLPIDALVKIMRVMMVESIPDPLVAFRETN